MSKRICRIFSTLFLVLACQAFVFAQRNADVSKITDKQLKELMDQIEARGLSESEVELMAKARGYTDADIAIIREKINQRKTGLETKSSVEHNVIAREQLGELSKRVETEDKTDSLKLKKIFGKEIFNQKKLTFEPNLRIATPQDYVLGADDELSINISGYASASYNLKVSPEGEVRLENLAPIYVNGLTVSKAKEKIHQRLSSLYAGLRNGGLKMDMELTKVKTIQVTVIGEVEQAGTYSVSSLSTLFNALYLAGGPSDNGTFRNIQLLRNNKVIQQIDIYDFLLKGSLSGNVPLQDRDVIFISVVGSLVEFDGEVRRPYRFELKPTDSLNDAIKYAGGFTEKAYHQQIKITRNTSTEKQILTVSADTYSNFLLKNGDKVEVGAILDRYTNRVEVMGAVFRPGEYALETTKTVSQLIAKAEGLREDAFKTRAFLKRVSDNLDPVLVPVNLDSVLLGFDVKLKREDVLVIKSITELREFRKVNITGRVNIPGEYDYLENMSVNDLIVMSGGFREGASPHRIEVSRRNSEENSAEKTVEVFTVDVSETLSSKLGNIILSPFDEVIVRELPNYQVQQMVHVTGEITYPGVYSIANRTERITDLIDRAGGVRSEAYIRGVKFYREGKQVALDMEEVLRNRGKASNLFLHEGDSLHIPKEQQTVKVSGEVLNPTSVAYHESLSFRDYVTQAGGYTDSAFVKKVYVKYPNGQVDKTRSFLAIKSFPKVEKGMEIIVPVKKRERMSKAEVIAISTGLVSLSAVLLTLIRVL